MDASGRTEKRVRVLMVSSTVENMRFLNNDPGAMKDQAALAVSIGGLPMPPAAMAFEAR